MNQRRLARCNLGAALALALVGCGGTRAPASARPSLLEPTRALSEEVSPAHWLYHPRRPAQLSARYDLGSEGKLFVGESGERWLVHGQPASAEPASSLAPESLVGALRKGEASWVFVGESGTI